MFLSVFCATVLRIANENQVCEIIIHDKNCKTTRVFIPESYFCFYYFGVWFRNSRRQSYREV